MIVCGIKLLIHGLRQHRFNWTAVDVRHGPRPWWRHQIETFPRYWPVVRGIHRSPVNSPSQRPVTRNFDVFFDLGLNKTMSKQVWCWWFQKPSRSLWRHCNGLSDCSDCVMSSIPVHDPGGHVSDPMKIVLIKIAIFFRNISWYFITIKKSK